MCSRIARNVPEVVCRRCALNERGVSVSRYHGAACHRLLFFPSFHQLSSWSKSRGSGGDRSRQLRERNAAKSATAQLATLSPGGCVSPRPEVVCPRYDVRGIRSGNLRGSQTTKSRTVHVRRRIYCIIHSCAFGKFVGDRWIGRCRRSMVKRREELANDDSSNGSHGCGPLLRFNGIFPSREDLGCWRERRKLCTPVISLPRQVNNRANDERVSQEKNGEGRLFQLLGLRIMFAKVFERPL